VTNVNINNNSIVNETWGVVLGNSIPATPIYIQGNANVTNNVISMHSSAMQRGSGVFSLAFNANVLIANNDISFTTAGARGIDAFASDQVQTSILNNYINGINGSGITATIPAGGAAAATTATFIIQGNTISDDGGNSINITSSLPATTVGSNKFIVLNNTGINETSVSTVTNNANSSLLLRFNNNNMPALNLVNTGTLLYVEPPVNNTTNFTTTGGTSPIIPIVPCQFGGPDCPQ
jgi:hypothetical protein